MCDWACGWACFISSPDAQCIWFDAEFPDSLSGDSALFLLTSLNGWRWGFRTTGLGCLVTWRKHRSARLHGLDYPERLYGLLSDRELSLDTWRHGLRIAGNQ